MTELPAFIINPFMLCCIVYWMANLYPDAQHFFIFSSAVIVHALTALSLFVFVGAATPNPSLALILAPVSNILFILFGGFFVQSNNIPSYLAWFRFLSYFQYTSRIILKNEFQDAIFSCDLNSTACGGENGTYPGHLELMRMEIQDTEYWHSYLILFGMIIIFRFATFLVIYFFHVEKR